MTDATLTFLSGSMGGSILPIAVDIMAPQAKPRLFSQQVCRFPVAMRGMTGIAVQ